MEINLGEGCERECKNVLALRRYAAEQTTREQAAAAQGLTVAAGRITCAGLCTTRFGQECDALLIKTVAVDPKDRIPPEEGPERRRGAFHIDYHHEVPDFVLVQRHAPQTD